MKFAYNEYAVWNGYCFVCAALGRKSEPCGEWSLCSPCQKEYEQEKADIECGKRSLPPGLMKEAFREMVWMKIRMTEAAVDNGIISKERAMQEMAEIIREENNQIEYDRRRQAEATENATKIRPKTRLY